MNEWKYQQRRKKRMGHCLINAGTWGRLCGCGGYETPSKAKKARIIKRELSRQLRKQIALE